MPWVKFEAIENADEAVWFFEHHFPDAVPLIGRCDMCKSLNAITVCSDNIAKLFFSNKTLPLMIVKVGFRAFE